jgi:hypothetical protein
MRTKPREKSRSHGKPKNKPDDEANRKQTKFWTEMKAILDHAISTNSLGIILFTAASIGAGYLLQEIFNNRGIWWGYITAFSLGNIFLFCAFYAWDKSATTPSPSPSARKNDYSIKILAQMGPNTKDPCDIWFVRLDQNRKMVGKTPVSAAVFLEFTNESNDSYVITSYSLDVESADGIWRNTEIIPVDSGLLFMGQDVGKTFEMKLDGVYFDSFFKNRRISPKLSVKGWMFINFDGPTPAISLRIHPTFMDLTGDGATTVELPGAPSPPSPNQTDLFHLIVRTVESGPDKGAKIVVDLRDLPVVSPNAN